MLCEDRGVVRIGKYRPGLILFVTSTGVAKGALGGAGVAGELKSWLPPYGSDC